MPTPEAKQESLVLFDKVIARKGDLAETARLMKARSLGPTDAAKELLPWFEQMKKGHPLRLRVGLELGDALYNSAGTDPAPQQLIRYQMSNHLGSVLLELDDAARIISYEE